MCLAFSETLGKSAQTEAMTLNIKASDLWNFFQAKTIRRTVVLTAAEAKIAEATAIADAEAKQPIAKQIAEWQKTAARYRSEPETREGTVELAERAKEAEHERDTKLAQYHNYELASAAFQIGIVLCSAAVITGMVDPRLARRRHRRGRRRHDGARIVRAPPAPSRLSLPHRRSGRRRPHPAAHPHQVA